ncbi:MULTISPECIES: hypothetical protein [unclassified Nodularia (in: cyanobacteria)]|uniref:hypothetical protein n=1 Tax=unclassified Nodularia (in: cyanobacteria) TaxID=2656917 RepID=UPI00187F1792|nr:MULTISPECIES: hypothetical protein [unclassified Nodularia (in: cyanobacteria)]MBE9200777.1 hypothetical protein [Nodularia sp. LEGE 06071]MCC2695932.1 hypothetical protein [Nodularia sp. LEGE 04288]
MELTPINQKYQEYSSPYCFIQEPKENKYPLGFHTFNENKILLKTKNLTNRIKEHKPDNLEKQKTQSIKIDEIDKLSTFEDILKYGIDVIKLKDDYIFKRISELKELCDLEADYDVALESLKSMFLFIGTIRNISKPSSITVSETGLFYVKWQIDRNNSITLRFQKDYFLDYVIFKPSSHTSKRIILNGSMNAMDLIDYLNDLNIKIHQQI